MPLLHQRLHHLRWKIVDAVRLVAADKDSDKKERADGDAAKRSQRTPNEAQSCKGLAGHARMKREQDERSHKPAQGKVHQQSLKERHHVI